MDMTDMVAMRDAPARPEGQDSELAGVRWRASRVMRRMGPARHEHPLFKLMQRHWGGGADALATPGRVAIDPAAIASRIGELPMLPRALAEVLKALQSDEVSTDSCTAAIEHDVSLSLRVLKLANSPFYGAPGRVGSIGDAVRLLGLRTVAGVVAAVSLQSTLLKAKPAGFDFERYWCHALATATLARELAPFGRQDADEAFIAGLLHDIGQMIMAVLVPDAFAKVSSLARQGDVELRQVELEELGVAHDAIGAQVAQRWGFPESIAMAISSHHQPGQTIDGVTSLGAIVRLADVIAHALDLTGSPDEAAPALSVQEWGALGLTEDGWLGILARTEEAVAYWTRSMGAS